MKYSTASQCILKSQIGILCLVLGSIAAAQSVHTTNRWQDAVGAPAEWFSSNEAVHLADQVLAYQNDDGGWPKNIDMSRPPSAERREARRDSPVSTIDNGATYTQLRLVARVAAATGEDRFRQAFFDGLDYLLDAQYANGGWPMFYPVRRGYYEHITFNDGSMIGVMRLLKDVAGGQWPFEFVDDQRRQRAAAAVDKGIEVILACQVVVDGDLTVWCAQHDHETLEPAMARSYELPSLSGSESVGIVRFLMDIESPSPRVIEAVKGAIRWFDEARINGIRVERVPHPEARRGYDYVVREDPAADPLWARFYDIGTNCPMFVGRDGVVKRRLSDIELERRTSYAYLGDWPRDLLSNDYPAWRKRINRQ